MISTQHRNSHTTSLRGRLPTRALTLICAVFGAFLLLVNIFGSFIALRSPHITTGNTYFGARDLTLTPQEVLDLVQRRKDEPTRDLVVRATQAVNQGLAHDYPQPVPLTENWILWLFGQRGNPYQWEFADYRRALERGFGLCSQHAIVLEGVLEEQGVRTQIVSLGLMHVVNRVEVTTGEWVIADPDYGIVLPDLPFLTPAIIREAYAEPAGYARTEPIPGHPDLLSYLVAAYEQPVQIAESAATYSGGTAHVETLAYLMKWPIPILLILPAGLGFAAQMRNDLRRRTAK